MNERLLEQPDRRMAAPVELTEARLRFLYIDMQCKRPAIAEMTGHSPQAVDNALRRARLRRSFGQGLQVDGSDVVARRLNLSERWKGIGGRFGNLCVLEMRMNVAADLRHRLVIGKINWSQIDEVIAELGRLQALGEIRSSHRAA